MWRALEILFLKKWDHLILLNNINYNLFFLFFFLSIHLFAAIKIPNGLDQGSRNQFLKQLGFSSGFKYLSQGYILGGSDGLELSTSLETVPFSRTNYLSQSPIDETDRILLNIIIGKGLFQNVDFFFSFSPFIFQNQISSYGVALKYIIYQDTTNAFDMGLFFHGNGLNISNLVGMQTSGLDLVSSYYSGYWSYYLAFGMIRTIGSFVGGINGVTSDSESAVEDLFYFRIYSGVSYNFGKYFLSLQIDRAYNEVFSAKVGTRF